MRLFVAALALALPLLAGAPNFSGSWMLNHAKSEFGQFPAPEVMLRSVTQTAAQVKMSTYQKSARGEVTTDLQYTTDGKAAVNGNSTGTARLQGQSLVIESSVKAQGASMTQRDVWTLSDDGKTLTVQSHVTLPNGEFDVKQVFEKTPGSR